MTSLRSSFAFGCTFFIAAAASAQDLPQPSPRAKVEQTVGVTNFAVAYASPGVKGRAVLGKLVPLGEYWRSGANAATTISFDKDVTMLGTKVPAGTYRFGTIPTKSGWFAVLSQEGGSPVELDDAKVVAKAKVSSRTIRSRERLTYLFENATDDSVDFVLEWSTFKVVTPITIDTDTYVAKALDGTLRDSWRNLMRTGRYLKNNGKYEEALVHLNKSLAVQETWWSTWYKAETLAAMGNKKEAIELAKTAQTLGKGDNVFDQFFAKDVEDALVAWAK